MKMFMPYSGLAARITAVVATVGVTVAGTVVGCAVMGVGVAVPTVSGLCSSGAVKTTPAGARAVRAKTMQSNRMARGNTGDLPEPTAGGLLNGLIHVQATLCKDSAT